MMISSIMKGEVRGSEETFENEDTKELFNGMQHVVYCFFTSLIK